jgi:hypothetical protein
MNKQIQFDGPSDDPDGIKLRLSAQRALLGNIPKSLRSASIEYRRTEIACRFIYDGEPANHDKGLMSSAAAEIIADFRDPYTISEEHLAILYPQEMTCLRHIVFVRHEG